MGDLEEILGWEGLAPSLSRFMHLLTQPASCGLPAWHMVIQLLLTEYQGLVHGLRRAKKGVLSPLHVVGDSAILLSQLRTYHSPRKLQLAQLYDVAKDLADDVAVVSWGHHCRDYNKMADCAANIAMDTYSSVQVRIPSGRRVVKELALHLDNDVNHWIETSTNEHADSSGPTYTGKDRILSQENLALRGGMVRGTIIA